MTEIKDDGALAPLVPTELVARLVAAETGSQELDLLLRKRYPPRDETEALEPWNCTGSVDAALALAGRVITKRGPIDLSIYGSAQVLIHHHDPCGNTLATAFGKTPALALCIAVLRADIEARWRSRAEEAL